MLKMIQLNHMLNDYFKNGLLFWVALAAFVSAILLDLYLRTKKYTAISRDKAHSGRIDKGLAHFRKQKTTRITNDMWQEITGASDSTATRDLNALVKLGVLKKAGVKRGTYYTFIKHGSKSK